MSDRFPHRFTPEERLANWQRLRVEHLSFRDAILNTLSYFRKSIYKKHSASPETLRHFAAQRHIFRHLADQPAAPGAARASRCRACSPIT